MKAIPATTCVDAWLQASTYLLDQADWRAYTVVLEIADPLALPPGDRAVYDLVDGFLRENSQLPISTVVNTIFPAQLYQSHGSRGVYEEYPARYPDIQCHSNARNWGTYAMRMIQRTDHAGNTIYPLRDLVEKVSSQAKQKGGKHAAYEMGTVDPFTDIPIYDPGRDRRPIMGGPCLSHVSVKLVKLTSGHAVHLTGFYRSHWYIQRALGNFLGLAHLQNFIACEAGVQVGPLVIHSSMAQLETSPGHWGSRNVQKLIEDCRTARDTRTVENEASRSGFREPAGSAA
jgi:hypothetical protein